MSASAIPFPEVSSLGTAVPTRSIPGTDQVLGEIEKGRLTMYRKMQIEAMERGWDTASVINLHPFSMTAQGVLLHEPKLVGVSLEEEFWKSSLKIKISGGIEVPFTQFVIALPEFSVLEQVVGMETDAVGSIQSRTWWPIELANDIVIQNNSFQVRGGMFAYKGSHAPMKATDRKHISGPNQFGIEVPCHCNDCIQKLADQAYSEAIAFYTSKFMEAEEAMSSGHASSRQRIKVMHRSCTRYLRRVGVLKQDPTWLADILTNVRVEPLKCVCGLEVSRDAVFCKECQYILKPFRAYREGVIELDTPGAVTALRRCSKEQLEQLGIYPEVLPLEEYRAARRKEAVKAEKQRAKDRE